MGIGKQIRQLFGEDPLAEPARALYGHIVEQARQPAFYTGLAVPDSLDGRFELVALHAFLVLRRLKHGGAEAAGLAQVLVDGLIVDIDHSLREMGVGDLGVGKRVKAMARGFYGRIAAYEAGLDGTDALLSAALARNLYGTTESGADVLATMVTYVRDQAAALETQILADILAGTVVFDQPPPHAIGGHP